LWCRCEGLPVRTKRNLDQIQAAGRTLDVSHSSNMFLCGIVEEDLPRIRQPIQLFLKCFRMVFDAAVNIDQITVSIIEYLHLAGHRITAKEHPSGSAENLNITTNLIRKTV